MGDLPPRPQSESPLPTAEERLDSWKEIAAYLRRDVSTVQRWEKRAALPVHRHTNDKVGTVFAYKSQLDAWWNHRVNGLEQQQQAKPSSRRRLGWALAAAAVVVAAGFGLWWVQRPPLPFEQRDWVLIANFENRTGEAVFDGTLEYALERELSNSRFVNVVPRQRINDTLRLMKQPLDANIDTELGREVALRDGGIRALLTGRVEKLDTTYVLSAALVNPTDGVTVASFSEEAEGQKNVVPALRRLSNRVRETLGEELSSIRQTDKKLEKVTTPSLRALQLYSQADALILQGKPDVAEELLKQAVTEDPEFASGYIHLAWAIRNQGRPADEYLPYAERALQLSDITTERERYFIRGSYYHQTGQEEKAIAAYEALLRLHPDHYWGANNLGFLYALLGQPQEIVSYYARRAELRPNDFLTNFQAAFSLVNWANNPTQAKPYVLRALKLASPDVRKRYPNRTASIQVWFEFLSFHEHWLAGDLEKARSEITRLAQTLDSRSGRERDIFARRMGTTYLALGQFEAAAESFERISDMSMRHLFLAWLAFEKNDPQVFREHIAKVEPAYREAVAKAHMGLVREAEEAVASMQESGLAGTYPVKVAQGALALARGQPEAIALLEEGVESARLLGHSVFFLASASLARAWEQQGDLERALQVLEAASEEKARAYLVQSTWIRIRWRLAQLYRKLGREAEAQEIEAELRELLAYADPDIPILLQLKAAQNVAVTQPPK